MAMKSLKNCHDRPTKCDALAMVEVSGGLQSFNVVNQMREHGR